MRKRAVIIAALTATAFVAGSTSLFIPLPRENFRKESVHSLRILDRRDILLREFLNDQQGRGRWAELKDIAPEMLLAAVAVEDKRFYAHPGIDPYAILRASIDDIKAGRFVSGGSTITQQVIRNVFHQPRSLYHKLIEAWYALRLERMMPKGDILEQYLNRAPFGNQLIGIESASRQYFEKPPRDLSLAESAFLASLPNAPALFNPYKNMGIAVSRQRIVLRRMFAQGKVSKEAFERALVQPLNVVPREGTFLASHAVEMVARGMKGRDDVASVQTTIDVVLQQYIESLVKGHLAKLAKKNVTNAAVMVIDNKTREIRVMVGSADYFDEVHGGQVNGVLAARQPGSAIKPFTYGLALEAGYSPADGLADIPLQIPDDRGDYIPENYDRKYHGPVTLRTALACSYNIPAVRILQTIGKENLLNRLIMTGFTSLNHPAVYYGYGLTLGNGEVTLFELTNAYASLACGGMWRPPILVHAIRSVEEGESENPIPQTPHRVFDERTSFLLTNILSDPVARRPAFGGAFHFPFPCAVKTGTTKDYRDNWTIGYTTDYTVGVWAGNFDGSPMKGVSGITGAGQIFSDIMFLLHMPPFGKPPGEFSIPPGLAQCAVCPRSGLLTNENCSSSVMEWFLKERTPKQYCNIHQRYRIPLPSGGVVEQVFEVYPPEFDSWCEGENLGRLPAEAVRVHAGRDHRQASLPVDQNDFAIVSPNDGDMFKIDPVLRTEYQTVKVVARLPFGLLNARLHVNETEEIPFTGTGVWWHLRKGFYRFHLTGLLNSARLKSRSITIQVE